MTHRFIHSTAHDTFGDMAPTFVEYTENVLFGDLWRREQLSLRERSLITISALVAGGATEQLRYHIQLAQDNGLTDKELVEAVTHLAFYAGWPRAASALLILKSMTVEAK